MRRLGALALGMALLPLAGCASWLGFGEATAPPPIPAPAASVAPVTMPAQPVMVAGALLRPTQTLAAEIGQAPGLSMLGASLRATGLVDKLAGPGPFTLFAPTNQAFDQLPPETASDLMRSDGEPLLAAILALHIVPGRLDKAELGRRVAAGGGEAQLLTLGGEILVARDNGPGNIVVVDGQGNTASIAVYDAPAANGIVHAVDRVLQPRRATSAMTR
jgi:uncharacterized surface protein with fasciclin (FAS1) repeats